MGLGDGVWEGRVCVWTRERVVLAEWVWVRVNVSVWEKEGVVVGVSETVETVGLRLWLRVPLTRGVPLGEDEALPV